MKKIVLTLLLLFTFIASFAQFVSVLDANGEVYGYLTLYRLEKVNKDKSTFLLKFQDINLNEVSSTSFEAYNYKLKSAFYNGQEIFIKVSYGSSYYLFNPETGKIGELREISIKKGEVIESIFPIQNEGFAAITSNFDTKINHLYAINNQHEELYTTTLYTVAKKKSIERFIKLASNENVAVFNVKRYAKRKAKISTRELLIVNVKTGEVIKSISIDDKKTKYEFKNAQIIDNKIVVYGDTFKPKTATISAKTTGMFRIVLDVDGTITHSKTLTWKDVQQVVEVRNDGYFKKQGFLYTHDFKFDKQTGNSVMAGEYFQSNPIFLLLKDFVFFEFDKDFNITQVFDVEKKSRKIIEDGYPARNFFAYGSYHPYYAYQFSHFLEEKKGLTFFYFSVEKISLISGAELTSGLITYYNGEFAKNNIDSKLSLFGSMDQVPFLMRTKPGYFLLIQADKDGKVDVRQEKIDY